MWKYENVEIVTSQGIHSIFTFPHSHISTFGISTFPHLHIINYSL
jgi:hypothetical protein